MRYLLTVLFFFAAVLPASALSLYWDANAPGDNVTQYHVYVCKTPGCTSTDKGGDWIMTVQSMEGATQYKAELPNGVNGAASLTAENRVGISPSSVSIPFSSTPVLAVPSAPGNVEIK